MSNMKLLIFLLIYCTPLTCSSNTGYRPFLEEGKMWHSCHSDMWGQYHRYCYIDGDTIVGGRLCKKWIQKIRWIQKAPGWLEDDGERVDCCALYEENNKIWCYLEKTTTPLPLFDFRAREGDTIVATDANAFRWTLFQHYWNYSLDKYLSQSQKKMEIIRKEQRNINGWDLAEIGFVRIDGGSYEYQASMNYIWAGIGDRRGPIFWTGVYSGDGTRNILISCTVGSELLYFDVNAAIEWNVPIPSSIINPLIVNGKFTNDKCYDLTGRRLSTPQTKGMYIEGGKLHVSKLAR